MVDFHKNVCSTLSFYQKYVQTHIFLDVMGKLFMFDNIWFQVFQNIVEMCILVDTGNFTPTLSDWSEYEKKIT